MSDLRCPSCSAHVAAGASWCTLCYADLRPKRAPAPQVVSDGSDLGSAPPGKHARPRIASAGHPTEVPEETDQIVEQLFAQLVASESGVRSGRYSGLVDNPAKKVGLIVGGAVAVMLLIFLAMAAVGALL